MRQLPPASPAPLPLLPPRRRPAPQPLLSIRALGAAACPNLLQVTGTMLGPEWTRKNRVAILSRP